MSPLGEDPLGVEADGDGAGAGDEHPSLWRKAWWVVKEALFGWLPL